MERQKLDTEIEKEAYKLVSNIKTHVQSFVHLYTKRTGLKLEPGVLEKLEEIVALGIEDGYGSQVAFFAQGVGKALDEYTKEENPTQLTSRQRKSA